MSYQCQSFRNLTRRLAKRGPGCVQATNQRLVSFHLVHLASCSDMWRVQRSSIHFIKRCAHARSSSWQPGTRAANRSLMKAQGAREIKRAIYQLIPIPVTLPQEQTQVILSMRRVLCPQVSLCLPGERIASPGSSRRFIGVVEVHGGGEIEVYTLWLVGLIASRGSQSISIGSLFSDSDSCFNPSH